MRRYQDDKNFEEDMRSRFDVLYMTYFGDLKKIEVIKDRERQFKGHDVHLLFKNDEKLVIDEKARRRDWDDVLIEYLSNKETGRLGWIYKNGSDYLAYLFPKKGCYLIDTQAIRSWVENKDSGFWKHDDVESLNERDWGNYTTVSKAIPLDTLKNLGVIYCHWPVR